MSQTHKKTASTTTSTTTIPTTELRKRSRRLVVLILHSRTKGHDKNGGTPPLVGVYIYGRAMKAEEPPKRVKGELARECGSLGPSSLNDYILFLLHTTY